MKVVVDTCVWSLFLRRKYQQDGPETTHLEELIRQHRVQLLGIIRQELLSGIKEVKQFENIRGILEGFPDLLANSEDHLLAARFFYQCRRKGIPGSPIDFLICAQASRNDLPILTTDLDFLSYQKHLPIRLISVPGLQVSNGG
jgi:hypothetical protein